MHPHFTNYVINNQMYLNSYYLPILSFEKHRSLIVLSSKLTGYQASSPQQAAATGADPLSPPLCWRDACPAFYRRDQTYGWGHWRPHPRRLQDQIRPWAGKNRELAPQMTNEPCGLACRRRTIDMRRHTPHHARVHTHHRYPETATT